jgi:hypothetical protein
LFCTIVARNYLDRAHALVCTLRRHHPDAHVAVLVLDGASSAPVDGVEYLTPVDVGLSHEDFAQMTVIYDVTELATAVKPWLLAYLLDSEEVVTYLDPDGEVFAPLHALPAAAAGSGLALVPHITRPIPRDGLFPDEELILGCGTFNLGVVAVSRAGRDFLAWWQERLRWDCLDEPLRGHFVDQRWVDIAVRLFPSTTVGDPGIDVAYWNLHERTVERQGDQWMVNGVPLRYFHYSGYSPAEPDRLSRYEGRPWRTSLAAEPALRALFDEYGRHLVTHRSNDVDAAYGYSVIDGVVLTREIRRGYRDELLRQGVPTGGTGQGFAAWAARRGRGHTRWRRLASALRR